MADYIHKNILCQAYIHSESDRFSEDELQKLKDELKEYVTKRAQFFLYNDVEISIDVGEGSFKSWASVLGTLTLLYGGIANYPSFREGIVALYDDVNRLSSAIVSESLFLSKKRQPEIIRIESRTGIIGSLKRVSDQILFIREHNGLISPERMHKLLSNTLEDVNRLISVLKNEEDRILVKEMLLTEAEKLPRIPLPTKKQRSFAGDIAIFKSRREELIRLLKNEIV
ncbi:MAG: hypothetical protein JW902_01245 [Syntrophaceae bacterium]|nr:hypothetical protein [Syntrophaceae bacterium]